MSDAALSKEALLASLRDLRLPEQAPGGALADLLVAGGVAALLACGAVALVRLVSVRRAGRFGAEAGAMIALTELPEDHRRVVLLHRLKAADPARFAALRGDLYRPGGRIDLAALEAEVARHV